jgi:alpha,alpha-trehalose phosphorylase
MRAGTGTLSFNPHLASGLSELRFRLRYRGRKLKVTIGAERAKYELIDGEPLALIHHGREFKLGKKPSEHDIPAVKAGPSPEQPPGRTPYSRSSY